MSAPIATGGRSIYPAIDELAEIPRWVLWKLERRGNKETKPPYCVGGRFKADSTDPSTWDTFDAAWRSAFVDGAATGIGIVLTAADDLMAADLDDCIHESGMVMPWARIIVRKLNSYTELSPSGTGLRIFFRSTPGQDWGSENGKPKGGRKVKFQDGHLELYRFERYLTVTGAHCEDPPTPETINFVEPGIIAELLAPAASNGGEHETGPDPKPASDIPDELRDRLNEAMAEDTALWEVWSGQVPEGSDTSRSAFDLKLAGVLRRHGGFSLEDFASLARWWEYGKGKDGDPRHWRRTWEKTEPPKRGQAVAELAELVMAQIIVWPALRGRTAPIREFILPKWIPARSVTLLHGFGGVGKSLLAQQIGTAAILRCEFLGGVADACPVLAWWGEDDRDEIWRRQENINAAFGITDIGSLEGKLIWRPCPGDDITMFTAANESDFKTTARFAVFREQVMDLRVQLAILDSAAQIAGIPENNRPLVTRCLQSLTQVCLDGSLAIVLIGHNNREGDFSGTTAWENRSRSRAHMRRVKEEDGSETIQLARPKANYAELESGVALEWHQGAYRCTDVRFETMGDRLDRQCREREIDQAFLAALDQLTKQRRATSAAKTAPNYAPRMMTQNGLAQNFSTRELEQAMRRGFQDDWLIADAHLWQKGNRHYASGLARKP
jgi:RecA-family ATPase